jgi:hypothetical protein
MTAVKAQQHPSQSVSQCQSVLALSPSGTHDQVLAVVKTVVVLSWGVLPDERAGIQVALPLQSFKYD